YPKVFAQPDSVVKRGVVGGRHGMGRYCKQRTATSSPSSSDFGSPHETSTDIREVVACETRDSIRQRFRRSAVPRTGVSARRWPQSPMSMAPIAHMEGS